MLLGGNIGNNGCASSTFNLVITYLSIGLIGLAIMFVFVGLILIEIRYRIKRKQLEMELNQQEEAIRKTAS